jgi:aromatic-L-amino-acid/L-tryptophan decarboxylase
VSHSGSDDHGTPPTLREAPLALSPDDFRQLGHALIDTLSDLLSRVAEGPVTPGEQPADVQQAIDAARSLPEHGENIGALLATLPRTLFAHSLLNGHPRFFGYITSSPAPIGMLGDLLASALNPNVGSWRLGPIATEIEAQTVRWIAQLVGYPATGGGLLVSGGNMANIVPFLAARRAAADWDVRRLGVGADGARRLRVYASTETHTWLQKAVDLAGLGTDAIHWIDVCEDLRIDVGALRAALAGDRTQGDLPMLVVGTGGSVSTGVVDPLRDVAAVCREHGVWFHVDGAYGALAAVADEAPADLGALHLADSVAVDPHKWLYAPLEAGCVLVRDQALLREAFSYHPAYYHFGAEALNYVDLGPQNSRGFRALKVWLALRQAGRAGYRQMIGDDIRLSRRLHQRVHDHPELEAYTQSLSINTFRFVPASLHATRETSDVAAYLDVLNEALLERLQQSGEVFVSNAVVRGRYLLRACIVNMNTTEADVDAVPDIVARCGRAVDAQLQSSGRQP